MLGSTAHNKSELHMSVFHHLRNYPQNRCTGHNGLPCFQCYSGQFCKTIEDPVSCKLVDIAGNPLFHVEYWLNGSFGDPCTSTLGHYRYCV
jgi:hypothetical protein